MEIANRELDGVIYLAMHLAGHGLPTLFGERMVNEYVFRLGAGRPVVYFDKDQSIDANRTVLENGGHVINLNAEGQNLDMFPQLIELFAKASPTFSAMFVRGEAQRARLAEAFPEDRKERVIATGHPSFDILDARFNSYHESADIVARHGRDYIQINTQFVTFNHKMGFDAYMKMVSGLKEWRDVYTNEEFLAFKQRQRDFEGEVANRFLGMAEAVAAAFSDRHVIVRPHPMEDRVFYDTRLGGTSNIFVEPDGPVRPWLATAGAVVHHSCTTGVEALLMGRTVVRFDPVRGEDGENMQSRAGLQAGTVEQVIEAIRNGVMPEAIRMEQLESMRSHTANCCGQLASPQIAAYVAGLAGTGETWIPEPLGMVESAKCWRKYLSKVLRARQPGRVGRKVRYALEKFPRVPLAEIRRLVERFAEADPGLPACEVSQLGLNAFLLTPKG